MYFSFSISLRLIAKPNIKITPQNRWNAKKQPTEAPPTPAHWLARSLNPIPKNLSARSTCARLQGSQNHRARASALKRRARARVKDVRDSRCRDYYDSPAELHSVCPRHASSLRAEHLRLGLPNGSRAHIYPFDRWRGDDSRGKPLLRRGYFKLPALKGCAPCFLFMLIEGVRASVGFRRRCSLSLVEFKGSECNYVEVRGFKVRFYSDSGERWLRSNLSLASVT